MAPVVREATTVAKEVLTTYLNSMAAEATAEVDTNSLAAVHTVTIDNTAVMELMALFVLYGPVLTTPAVHSHQTTREICK